MGYSKYVGRVGALAVALGIGTAVAQPAWADPQSPDSSPSPSSASANAPDEPSSSAAGTPPERPSIAEGPGELEAGEADSIDENIDGSEVDDELEEALDDSSEDLDSADAVNLTDQGADPDIGSVQQQDPPDDAGTSVASPAPAAVDPPRTSNANRTPGGSAPAVSIAAPPEPPAINAEAPPAREGASPEAGPASVETDLIASQRHSLQSPDNPGIAAGVLSATGTAAPPNVRQPKTPLGLLLGGPVELLRIASEALGMLFSPGPSTPGDPPLLLGVLAFVRREIQRTFFNSSPVAVADVATTSEGIPATITVLTNDTDPDINVVAGGDVLTVETYTRAAHGEVVLNPDGSFTYTPDAGFTGTDTFRYTVSDENSPWHIHGLMSLLRGGHRATTTVTVTVSAVDAAPVAHDDSVTTDEDTPVRVDPLANDEGDDLLVTVVDGPANGSLSNNPDGSFTYTPAEEFYGTDSFTYFASSSAASNTATVTITVNAVDDAPVIDSVISTPGTGNTWTLDVEVSDEEGDVPVVSVSASNSQVLTITAVGPKRYTVTADSNWALAHPGVQVSVLVSAAVGNQWPATSAVVVGTVSNAVGFGTDISGDQIEIPALPAGVTYTHVAARGSHVLLLRSDGTVIGLGDNSKGQLDIPDLPVGLTYTQVAAGALHTVLLRSDGTAVAVGDDANGKLDIPDLPPGVTYTQVAAGALHTVLLRSDGTAVGIGLNLFGQKDIPDPPPGTKYIGVDSGLTHTILLRSDGAAIGLGLNSYGQADVPDLPPGIIYSATTAGTLHSVVIGTDGVARAVGWNEYGQLDIPDTPAGIIYTAAAAGSTNTVLLRSDGTAIAVGWNGAGQNDIATLPAGVEYVAVAANDGYTLLLTAPSLRPVAAADTAVVSEDGSVSIDVLANDISYSAGTLVITAVGNPEHGTAVLGSNGRIVYTPDADFYGTDTFTYTLTDGFHPDAGTVTVTVVAVDDAPVIESVTSVPGIGNSWTIIVDAGNEADTTVSVQAEDGAHVVVTPAGTNRFTVTVSDAGWARRNPGAQVRVVVTADDPTHDFATSTIAIGSVSNAVAIGANYAGNLNIPALPAGMRYAAVAAGDFHTVLLRSDGTVIGVGANGDRQIDIPELPEGVTYTAVAAGDSHTVLLRSDGTAVAFGWNGYGQIDVPDPPEGITYTAISAGDVHTVLLRSDGVAVSFGDNGYGATDIPTPPEGVLYTAVAAGGSHTVLLRSDGMAVAFGDGYDGQTDIPGLEFGVTYVAVAAGDLHTVLLRSDGAVNAVGRADFGMTDIPAAPAGVVYTGVAASGLHTVLLRSDGVAIALGDSTSGQIPIAPAPDGVDFVGIGAGDTSTILLTATTTRPVANPDDATTAEDNAIEIEVIANDSTVSGATITLVAIGTPSNGAAVATDDGTIIYTPNPDFYGTDTFTYSITDGTLIDAATVTVTVTAANDAPAIQSVTSLPGSGNSWQIYVHGIDVDGDMLTTTLTASEPTHVTITPNAYGYHTVTVTDSAWALAHPGAQIVVTATLIDPSGATTTSTVAIGTVSNLIMLGANATQGLPALPAGVTYTKIAIGGEHTVLLRSDGYVVAAGSYVQFDGPTAIPPLPDGTVYTDVVAGGAHTVLLRSDGTVVAVGSNSAGQRTIPALAAGTTYVAIAAGNSHTVLLRSDGAAFAIGSNTSGQSTVPVLPPGTTYTAIAADEDTTVYLRSDGTAASVGPNSDGQNLIATPPAGTRYTAIATSGLHTVLLRSDGTAVGFGAGVNGQITIPNPPAGLDYVGVAVGDSHTVLLVSDGSVVAVGSNFNQQGAIPVLPGGVVYTSVFAGSDKTVLLTAAGSRPIAIPDAVSTNEDTTVVIDSTTLLSNDLAPGGGQLTITDVGIASHGTATLATDGSITYTPHDDYYGIDSFIYTVTNGSLSAATTVTVTVSPVDDAPVINGVTSTPGVGNSWTITVDTGYPDGDTATTLTAVDNAHVTITALGGDRYTVIVTDIGWARANPGAQISVVATASDTTHAPISSAVAIGTVSNVVLLTSLTPEHFYNRGQLDIPALPAGMSYTAMDFALTHTVLLRSDGTVVAIGANQYGQLTIPTLPTGVTYTAVSTSEQHTVLLRSDGTAVAVGYGAQGQTSIPALPPNLRYTAVAAGGYHTVLLRSDGEVIAVGLNGLGQNTIPTLPAGVTYTAIAAGDNHTLLLRSDGQVIAIGDNGQGQVTIPGPPTGLRYTAIAAGRNHTALLRSDGAVLYTQATSGTNSTVVTNTPPAGTRYIAVAAGNYQTLMLRSDGSVQQIWSGLTPPAVPAGLDYTKVFVGGLATAFLVGPSTRPDAVADSATTAEDGVLVIDPATLLANDTDPDGDTLTVTTVGKPAHGTATIGADGTITYTPHRNYFGTDTFTYTVTDGVGTDSAKVTVTISGVNDVPLINSVLPTPGTGNSWTVTINAADADSDPLTIAVTAELANRVSVTPVAPNTFTVAVTDTAWALAHPGAQIQITTTVTDGNSTPVASTLTIGTVTNVLAQGANTFGQTNIPALPAGVTYVDIAAGTEHTVLLRSDGTVVAVGNRHEPGAIPALPAGVRYTAIAAGNHHTLLLRSDGTVVGVGWNGQGQLNIPELTGGLTYTGIAAGFGHSVLLRSDGTAIAVGWNTSGESVIPPLPTGLTYTKVAASIRNTYLLRSDGALIAIGEATNSKTNVPALPPGVVYTDVSATHYHAIALRSDGNIAAFGWNGFNHADLPALPAGVRYTGIAAGYGQTVLLRSDGTVLAFGDNTFGQSTVPVLPAGVTFTDIATGTYHSAYMFDA